jgi:hypothetical protein
LHGYSYPASPGPRTQTHGSSSLLYEVTNYPDSPVPTRHNTPEPTPLSQPTGSQLDDDLDVLIGPPTISDAIASFKEAYGEEICSAHFEQYSIYWVDELPLYQIDWFVEKLGLTEDVAEKWSDHIVGIYEKYKADVEKALATHEHVQS